MKLQPNFSWQSYEGEELDYRDQFQFQLQQMHITTANAINATIDDESYWTRERVTSFTWTDGSAIWKRTITGIIVGTATTAYPLGVTGIKQVIRFEGSAQDATPMAVKSIPLPYVDPTALANGVGLYITPTDLNIIAGNGTWNGYAFQVTIYYTKEK